MEQQPDLWREGNIAGPEVDLLGRLYKQPLRVGRARSLAALTDEYVFFTPAILYVLGIVTDQPLLDFLAEYKQSVAFYFKQFRLPLFRGLEVDDDTGWNYALWAMHREYWPVFLDFYCSLRISNRPLRKMFGVGLQELRIIDPVAMERCGSFVTALPTLTVAAFGVNGNTFRAAFACGVDPLLDPPTLTYYSPNEAMQTYAASYYQA